MTSRRSGALWVVASAASYSLFAVFSKNVLDSLEPTDVLLWRFLIAAPVAWAVVLVRARRGGPGPLAAPPRAFLSASVLFGLVALLAFAALDHLSASLYVVIIYTYPAMVAIGAALLGRRPPRALWGAVALTTVGIALTVPEVFSADADADGLGLLFTLLNAAAYATYVLGTGTVVGGRPGSAAPDGLVASAWSMTGSLLFAVPVALIGGPSLPPDLGVLAGLVGLAVISTVVPSMTLFRGLASLPPATAALIATLEPVLTLVWAMTLLDESLVALQVVGAVLVLIGVVWAQRSTPVAAVESG